MKQIYKNKNEILEKAQLILGKSLLDVLAKRDIESIKKQIDDYGLRRKGYLGDIIETYFFGINPGNDSSPDFSLAGVELKTTPLKKHKKNIYASKERLVFSMINYDKVAGEKWESSSFLNKNSKLLILFYLWVRDKNILEYEFKFTYFLDLLNSISREDAYQIKKDWQFIVNKIRRGEAHLLSEADTYYLGACTKAANSGVVRDQPRSRVPAKPRAFSLKQQYLNYLIQKELLGVKTDTESIFKKKRYLATIEEVVQEKFSNFMGKTTEEIAKKLGVSFEKQPKHFKRILANRIMGAQSNRIEELEKANITLKAITLEHTGLLKESISFPSFKYEDLLKQVWYDEKNNRTADFYSQLESKKFLFVVFQKSKKSDEIILKDVLFWNFPMEDIKKAQDAWERTVQLISQGKIVKEKKVDKKGRSRTFSHFPGSSFNGVVHVRPHAKDSFDVYRLPVPDLLTGNKTHTKQCFWINASYIQQAIKKHIDQG